MAKNKPHAFTVEQVLVVHCQPLNDQWETDAHRTPKCIVPYAVAKSKYDSWDYEWFAVMPNGLLRLIKECEC